MPLSNQISMRIVSDATPEDEYLEGLSVQLATSYNVSIPVEASRVFLYRVPDNVCLAPTYQLLDSQQIATNYPLAWSERASRSVHTVTYPLSTQDGCLRLFLSFPAESNARRYASTLQIGLTRDSSPP